MFIGCYVIIFVLMFIGCYVIIFCLDIHRLLFNLTNYEIVIEPYRDFSTNARTTTFIFHAVEEGQIVDFSQFIKRLGSNRQILFTRLKPCNITELTVSHTTYRQPQE